MSLGDRFSVQNSENLSQYGDVQCHKDENCTLEDVFSVITTNVVNNDLTKPIYMNMPLLDDQESPSHKDLFATYGDSINNNYVEYHYNDGNEDHSLLAVNNEDQTDFNIFLIEDTFGMQNVQNHRSISETINHKSDDLKYFANHAAMAYIPSAKSCNSSMEESSNPVSANDDDISEFLVFHNRKPTEDDPKFKVGCFVKLRKNEVRMALKEIEDKRKAVKTSARKRKHNNSVEVPLAKKAKRSQTKEKSYPTPAKTSPSKGRRNKTHVKVPPVLPSPNNECPKIILKFVRLDPMTYQCVFVNDLSKRMEKEEMEEETMLTDCSVVIDALPTESTSQPVLYENKCTDAEMNWGNIASKTPIETKHATETGHFYDVESKGINIVPENTNFDNCYYDDVPLDLTLPKNENSALDFSMTRKGGKGNLLDGVDNENIEPISTSRIGDRRTPKSTENKDFVLPLTKRFKNQTLSMEFEEDCDFDSSESDKIALEDITSSSKIDNERASKLTDNKDFVLPLTKRFSDRIVSMEVEDPAFDSTENHKNSFEDTTSSNRIRGKRASKSTGKKGFARPLTRRFNNQILPMEVEEPGFDSTESHKISLEDTASPNVIESKRASKLTDNKDFVLPLTERFNNQISMEVEEYLAFDPTKSDKNILEDETSSDVQQCEPSSYCGLQTTHVSDTNATNKASNLYKIDEAVNSTTTDESSALASSELRAAETSNMSTKNEASVPVNSPSDDDNCSVTSELSIFAPSLSDIFNSPRDDSRLDDEIKSTANKNDDQKTTNFRIPKLKKTVDKQSGVDVLNSQPTGYKANGEIKVRKVTDRIEELGGISIDDIFRATIRHSPQMLSPVKDLLSRKDSRANDTKPKKKFEAPKKIRSSKKTDEKKTTKTKNKDVVEGITKMTKSEKCKEKSKEKSVKSTDTTRPSNVVASPEDVSCPVTRTNIRQSEDVDSGKQSNSDIKKIEKLVIKVSGGNTIRNVSLADEANPGTLVRDMPLLTPTQLPVSFSEQSTSISLPQSKTLLPLQSSVVLSHSTPLQDMPLLHHPMLPQITKQIGNQKGLENQSLPTFQANENPSSYSMNVETKKKYRAQTLALFKQPCINFLSKQPCEFTPCRYNHELPTPDNIHTNIQGLANDLVEFMYIDFIVKNATTFERYFPLFCQLYGTRKILLQFTPLMTADCAKNKKYECFIKDCEKYKKYNFFECIFEGLLACGVNKRDALILITDCCQICSASDQIILKIVQRDPQCFIDVLSRYATRVPLSPELLTKLLQQASNNSNLSQLRKCVDLLKQIGPSLTSVDKNVFTTFCQAVFQFKDNHLSEQILSIVSKVTN